MDSRAEGRSCGRTAARCAVPPTRHHDLVPSTPDLPPPSARAGEIRDRVVRRGRSNLHARIERLRQRAFLIAQVAVAAAVAWYIAHQLLGHAQPFFAPVAAIASLGMSYGQRLRRVGEVTAGVAVGVAVAEAFVRVAGSGVWQIGVVVGLAMTAAVLLDGGPLIVTQAAVQSVFVTIVLPVPSAGFGRWLDALVGGAVALAAAAIAPQTPLRRPREEAARVLLELSALLSDAAEAARGSDVAMAEAALTRARATDSALADLRSAAADGLAIVRSSPFRRRHRGHLERVAEIAEPVDHAVRNSRVLVRRVVAATRYRDTIPEAYVVLVEDLARVTGELADTLTERGTTADLRPELERLGQASAEAATAAAIADAPVTMSSTVILAQVRSMVVDLLELTGLDPEEALLRVPRPTG